MPKGKKKGKYEHKRTEQAYSSDEDAGIDMTIDNMSETSAQSDLKSIHDDPGNPKGRKVRETRIIWKKTQNKEILPEELQWSETQRNFRFEGPRLYLKKIVKEPDPKEKELKDQHLNMYYRPPSPESETEIDHKALRESEIQEKFEEKVLELIESLNARANAARATAFVSLRAALQRRALDGLLSSHRATLADHVSRALRRGKDGEKKAAAAIAPLLALQIGEEGTEEFVREVRPALIAACTDKSASLDTRTECCSSLAVLCYLMEDDLTEILEVMRMYETIFSGSYLKGDGSVKVSGAAVEEGAWHAAALDAWSLLLPLLSPGHALQLLTNQAPSFARLGDLLEAVSLEVRMAAGTALAIAYEAVTDEDGATEPAITALVDAMLPRLSELARDSHKFRAKRDRKLQRATFRDILKYFEEGEVPSMSVRVGVETASWSSWSGAASYGALAAALGGALQALAPRSLVLRAALGLSDVLPQPMQLAHKQSKLERHLQNNAACKARTLARKKNRDKRSAALAM
ncbi:hypothetical protein SFRURICE_005204 [Spodoptera frugiperda]|uniref:Interferon-related developmental regulator 1 isoform X1 n=1 Tax=Spodoptera frugiperda TaxID=7108 RepID=A0A2H1V9B4_SPOFR|nr:interferon-related developmental regulator 1 isoform X1 [Spodoptera frugiperda]KAF9800528.1 hypothetical protein SFRURICE_005204 [Spodoptera frugiperda]